MHFNGGLLNVGFAMNKIIYCEIGFLKILFERLKKTYSPLDDNWAEGEFARKIIKEVFSQKYVTIHYNDKQQFRQLLEENEYFRSIVKRSESTEGYAQMDCDSYLPIDSINETVLNAIYFVLSNESIATEKGIMALTPDTINDSALYKDFGIAIGRNEKCTWADILKKAQHHCNALMAFDNYLYNSKEDNLFSIFDTLLPKKMSQSISFQIALFMQEKPGISIENEYNIILNKIKEIRPELSFCLTIYQCFTSDFHDRAIITNNIWIGSEAGFDLMKKDKRGFRTESAKSTTIHMKYPFLQNNSDSAYGSYSNFIRDAERIMRANKKIGNEETNRLIM